MKKILYSFLVIVFTTSGFISLTPPSAEAGVNYNRIIDDFVFSNEDKMSAVLIDSFLNSFPSSCISTNKGFKAKEPIGYNVNDGFIYGSNVSAGKVIYAAAQAYDINPQVLLTTIQKEQTYVSGPGTYDCTNPLSSAAKKGYAQVMGYGCPDGGTTYDYSGVNLYTIGSTTVTSVNDTCVKKKEAAGFSQQVIRAAWLLKISQQRSLGNADWAIIEGSWDNSDDLSYCYSGPMTQGYRKRCPWDTATYFDGYTTIDGSSVHMDTGATAALYYYTPHKHGNLNFYNIFTGWFGSTLSNPVGISVTDSTSNESGGIARVKFSLVSQPSANVTIPLSLTDDSEASLSSSSVTITPANWNSPNNNAVNIAGLDDAIPDGDLSYILITHTPTSSDPAYGNLANKDIPNVTLSNQDNEPYIPLSGDWNGNGSDTISMRKGYVNLMNNKFDGKTDFIFNYGSYEYNYGATNDVLVGDWDGDGQDELGFKVGNRYYLNYNLDGSTNVVYQYGQASDAVLVGDWNGDGKDTISVRRGHTNFINNGFDGRTDFYFNYGDGTETTLVGDWNRDGKDTLSLRKDYTNRINNKLDGSTDFTYNYGASTDIPLAGDWNSEGRDTIALRRGHTNFINNGFDGSTDFTFNYGQ